VFLGEVEIDGERLPQDEAIVIDRRQAPVRVDGEVVRLARASRPDLDRDVPVVEPKLLRHPQRTKCAGPGNAVNAQHVCLDVQSGA
jgi:hypothetical protein